MDIKQVFYHVSTLVADREFGEALDIYSGLAYADRCHLRSYVRNRAYVNECLLEFLNEVEVRDLS